MQLALAILFILLIGGGAIVLAVWYWNSTHGPAVFVATPTAKTPTNPGVVRSGLRAQARAPLPQAKDPGPTLVSLELKSVSPQKAIETLSEKSGITVTANHDSIWDQVASKTVTIHAVDQPFWDALLDICKQSGLSLYSDYQSYDQIQVSANTNSHQEGMVQSAGTARVILYSMSRTDRVDLANLAKNVTTITPHFLVLTEPKLQVLSVANEATIERAVDDAGVTLKTRVRSYSGNPRNKWMQHVFAPMTYDPPARLPAEATEFPGSQPSESAHRLSNLKGYISAIVSDAASEQRVKDPLKTRDAKLTSEGVKISMIELKATSSQGKQYTGKFSVDMGLGNPQLFGNSNEFAATLSLRDAKGRSLRASGGPWSTTGNGRQEFTIYFHTDPSKTEPVELVAKLPQGIKELRIPFEFNDVVLPE